MNEATELKAQIEDHDLMIAKLKKDYAHLYDSYYLAAQKAYERGIALDEARNLRDRFKQQARGLEIKCDALLQRVKIGDGLAKQLKAAEWSAGGRQDEPCCPDCEGTKDQGHSAGCDLDQALILWSIVSGG